MKKVPYILLLAVVSCSTIKNNRIPIFFENNSDKDSVISIRTYVDDRLYKTIQVKRDTTQVRFEKIFIEHRFEQKNVKLYFIVERSNDTTSCIVSGEKLNNKSWVHVNFKEVIFKKGYNYLGHVLQKDSIVQKKFYCEIIN